MTTTIQRQHGLPGWMDITRVRYGQKQDGRWRFRAGHLSAILAWNLTPGLWTLCCRGLGIEGEHGRGIDFEAESLEHAQRIALIAIRGEIGRVMESAKMLPDYGD